MFLNKQIEAGQRRETEREGGEKRQGIEEWREENSIP